jgi:hypothetical protein
VPALERNNFLGHGVALAKRRVNAMNVRPSIHELDRIRRDIGARLRIEPEVAEPPPRLLMALLKKLEIHVHEAQGERLFAEVDARVAELKRAAFRAGGHSIPEYLTKTVRDAG